jgi:hypothetical protein
MVLPAGRPNPNNGGRGGPPYKPPVGQSTIHGSPGLLTSSGGLFGRNFQLLMPLFDATFNKSYFGLVDPLNNDTEEDCFYTFKQEDVMINRKVSVHLLIVTYREIGRCQFTLGVQVYIEDNDSYKTSSKLVIIAPSKNRKTVFPDGKLHSKKVNISVIDGERPQPFISRKANSGPLAITRILMAGKADEKDFI